MIKKLFGWTPRDIAYWEQIRAKGLGKFILTYGIVVSSGLLFLVCGMITVASWLMKRGGMPVTHDDMVFLITQLVFVALVCLAAGLINSLVTWMVEQRLYRKYKTRGQ